MTGLSTGTSKSLADDEILLVVGVLLVQAERIVAGNEFLVLLAQNMPCGPGYQPFH